MHQEIYTFTSSQGIPLHSLLCLPQSSFATSPKRWPCLLFLHGRGERGSDLNLLKQYGLPKTVENWQDSPFIILSPQCPADRDWSELIPTLYELLLDAERRLPIDACRRYLTGLSMGGRGSWSLAATYPTFFAAMLPICGRIPTADFLENIAVLKDLPIWVFHGAKDSVVPIENSDRLVAALRAIGSNVRYTVYPDATHDSWTETYNNPAIYEWLLEKARA